VHEERRDGCHRVDPKLWIRCVRPFESVGVIGVHDDHVAGFDPAEMHLIGVHQELCPVAVDRERKVVCDPFVHIEPCGPAKGCGQIDAFLPIIHVLHVGSLFGHAGSSAGIWSSLKPTSLVT